jgi:hypothetical protein
MVMACCCSCRPESEQDRVRRGQGGRPGYHRKRSPATWTTTTMGRAAMIIGREERIYPEMPEREEQEYLRMLAEDPWADGTEIDSGWTEDTGDD